MSEVATIATGTRVDVEHHGWERLGGFGAEKRDSYHEGWDRALEPYRSQAN